MRQHAKAAIKRDPTVPIRVTLPSLIAVLVGFHLANSWWAIILKAFLVCLALLFIKVASGLGSRTRYHGLGSFALWATVLFIVALWPSTPNWLAIIAGVLQAINYATIYGARTLKK